MTKGKPILRTSTAPPILSGVPGSFAWGVFHERHPKLIQQVLDAQPYGPSEQAAIQRLLVESTTGVLEPLDENTADREQWLRWGESLYGRPWGEAPFLWAESFFYRKLLQATGYFRPGAWHGIDPFAPVKNAELTSPAVSDELAALHDLPDLSTDKKREVLLASALWGNQADLGFQLTASTDNSRSSSLLVDDSPLLWSTLAESNNPTVCVVADNVGRELLPDLVLVDHLLTSGLASEIVLYVKPYPYYVSDATMSDVLATVQFLRASHEEEASKIGLRLWQAMNTNRLAIRTHSFFCAPLPFHDMPADLSAEFASATMALLKGDLNYRRLVGDQQWPDTSPFNEITDYFPSPVAVLRTLKSDVIVGLTPQQVADLDSTGQQWRANGKRAIIQVRVGRCTGQTL